MDPRRDVTKNGSMQGRDQPQKQTKSNLTIISESFASSQEMNQVLKHTKYIDVGNGPEPFTDIIGLKHLANALIKDGCCEEPERAMLMLQEINAQLDKKRTIVWCATCAQKVGIKQCSGCPKSSKTRYCSRECQVAAWPSHKTSCGRKKCE